MILFDSGENEISLKKGIQLYTVWYYTTIVISYIILTFTNNDESIYAIKNFYSVTFATFILMIT